MSLATLKKKTQSKYQNSSVGLKQFSINGTHRNQGYVGQTSLSRSLPRTLAGGAYNKGHGGCCDTYTDLNTPVVSGVKSTNDSSVVKSSVLSSKGMLAKRLRCCDPVVKPDNQTSLNSSSSYLEYLKNKCSQIETYSEYYVDDLWTLANLPTSESDYTDQSIGTNIIYQYNQTNALNSLWNGIYTFSNDGIKPTINVIHTSQITGSSDNIYNNFGSYCQIDFPFFIKISKSQLDFRKGTYAPNTYYLYGIDGNGNKILLLTVNKTESVYDGDNPSIKNDTDHWIEEAKTIQSDHYFKSFRIEVTHSGQVRIAYWKISGYVTDFKTYVTFFNTCTSDSDKACSSTHKDVIVASSQSDYLSRLKGKCLESTPEFQRVTNTCTSGRGACGGN